MKPTNGNGNSSSAEPERSIYQWAYRQGNKVVAPKRHRRHAFNVSEGVTDFIHDMKRNEQGWGYMFGAER